MTLDQEFARLVAARKAEHPKAAAMHRPTKAAMKRAATSNSAEVVGRWIDDPNLATLLDSLASRWQDESEYEDIKEYAAPIEKHIGAKIERMTTRPFGFVCSVHGVRWAVTMKPVGRNQLCLQAREVK